MWKFILKLFNLKKNGEIEIMSEKYTLITFFQDKKYEFESKTLDEILSLTMDAYNQNHELIEIQKNGKILYQFCEIYELIGKVYY